MIAIRYLLLISVILGCSLERTESLPPPDEVHFPASVLPIPGVGRALVMSTVIDRAYTVGQISVFNPDEIPSLSSVIISGLFGGQLSLSYSTSRERQFVVVPTRDNDLVELYALDVNGDLALARLNTYSSFGSQPMARGPMSTLALDHGFLIGHPVSSTVSYWGLDDEDEELDYGCSVQIPGGVGYFDVHPVTGEIYITSQFSRTISVVRVENAGWLGDPSSRTCRIVLVRAFDGRGTNHHDLSFSSDGSRLYVSGLNDGDIKMFDTAPDTFGVPADRLVRRTWLGEEATMITLDKTGTSVFVAMMKDKQVVQLDGESLLVQSVIETEGNPYDLAFVESDSNSLLAITYFDQHEVGVFQAVAPYKFEPYFLEDRQ